MPRMSGQSRARAFSFCAVVVSIVCVLAGPAFAQGPPVYPPAQLDRLVSRIALYPDPLLAQVLAAATFPDDIPDAARWADEHHYLTGDALAAAIEADRLPWDPSVQALLPFPNVLDMMASDMAWTTQLGDAFVAQEQDVMDAVQRMRRRARDYGYLRSSGQIRVITGPYIEILPLNPAFIVVPAYDPAVVFVAPRPGFVIAGAIRLGFGVAIGPVFRPWGWGLNRFVWNSHTVIINNSPWRRTWANRSVYVHPYTVKRYPRQRRVEQHELHQRTQPGRAAEQSGAKRVEKQKQGKAKEKSKGEDRR
jgi:hypothetical protein